MFFQLFGRRCKRIIGSKIHHGALQPMRIPPALDRRRFLERTQHPTGSSLTEDLLLYFDFSEDREPIERFFFLRLTPALAAYSFFFFSC